MITVTERSIYRTRILKPSFRKPLLSRIVFILFKRVGKNSISKYLFVTSKEVFSQNPLLICDNQKYNKPPFFNWILIRQILLLKLAKILISGTENKALIFDTELMPVSLYCSFRSADENFKVFLLSEFGN